VGGSFTQAGSVVANNIARWDGFQWHALGDGVNNGGGPPAVYAITINGSDVYVGGNFYSAGTITASNIASWDGTQWDSLSSGAIDYVRALAVDGLGNLFVGGDFNGIGGVANCGFIAMWDGSQWNALDSGVSGNGWSTHVNALTAAGTEIYVGGYFEIAGEDSAKNMALWDGSNWYACGSGTDGEVFNLDYKNLYVYASGDFIHAGGTIVNYIAKYNGTWQAIDNGVDYAPHAMDYGTIDVFVGASKSLASANNICKYDCCWDPFGSGVDSTLFAIASQGDDLWVGGLLQNAGGKPSVHFGHWNPNVIFYDVEKIPHSPGWSLYPNPCRGNVTIEFQCEKSQEVMLTAYNAQGKKILEKTINAITGLNSLSVELGQQPAGLYYLELKGDGFKQFGKLIIN
jgi:trimeric autotransporter adhesin